MGVIARAIRAAFPPQIDPIQAAYARSNIDRARLWYDATRGSNGTDGWTGITSPDPNAQIRTALLKLREIGRNLVRNNGHASHARNVIAANVIGTGIIPTIVDTATGRRDQLENLLEDHFDTPACDFRGELSLYGLQDLIIKTVVESGECLVRWRQLTRAEQLARMAPLPFQIEVLEPDYINQFIDGPRENGNFAIEGVEFDQRGRRVGYHLFRYHPGSTYMRTYESTFVPADQVAHIRRVDRPGQVHGVSWFAPVVVKFADFADYSYAQLVKQKVAACFTAFLIGTGDDGSIEDPTQSSESGYALEAIEPGMIQRLKQGEDVKFGNPPTIVGFDEYARVSQRDIAAGMDISYEAMTGDLTGVNFASSRVGRIEFLTQCTGWQNNIIIPQFLYPLSQITLRNAGLMGVGISAGRTRIKWTPPRRQMVSPKDEVPYLVMMIRAGIKTRSDVIRELGYDPANVDAEFAADNERADNLGLVFDTDARHRTSVGNAVMEPSAEADDAAAAAADDPAGDGSNDNPDSADSGGEKAA